LGNHHPGLRHARRPVAAATAPDLEQIQPARQIGALPWRRRQGSLDILLVTSRDTGRWVIPKGWPMRNLLDFNAAKQEAWEEAGVEGSIRRVPLGQFRYQKRLPSGVRTCLTTVYGLCVLRELADWPERHQRRRRWFDRVEAAALVQEPELTALILDFHP
jgi:8-oxo-dGTP pyrophosphatase MutT (NUDIX family)